MITPTPPRPGVVAQDRVQHAIVVAAIAPGGNSEREGRRSYALTQDGAAALRAEAARMAAAAWLVTSRSVAWEPRATGPETRLA